MRKKITLIVLLTGILLITYVLMTLSFNKNNARVRIDGKKAELLAILFMADTKYADGYSNEKFLQIKIGMSEKNVIDILGEPLKKWSPYIYTKFSSKRKYVGFEYSTSPSSGSYRLRQINFNQGKVAEIIAHFYLD